MYSCTLISLFSMLSLSKSIHLHSSAVRVSVRHMQISRTVAGVTVATYPEPGLTAGLSVVVGGGSRYEDENTAGAAQYLKNFAFMVCRLNGWEEAVQSDTHFPWP